MRRKRKSGKKRMRWEFYSNSKTKVSKNLFTRNYLIKINLNLNLKSGKNRPKKRQEQDKIIWKKFSTKLSESKNFFYQFFSYLNSDLKVRNRNYLELKNFFTKFS